MALTSFSIRGVKALGFAEANPVPKVMVIAGPNGIGKSTLLYEIHKRNGVVVSNDTRIVYQPPHRALRRTTVRRRWLGGAVRSILDLFTGNDVSGFEGLNFPNSSRTPENVDEAGSTFKHTLGG